MTLSADKDREVKPCPFCGGTNVETREGSTFRWVYAACNECDARAGEVRMSTLGNGTREQRRIEADIDAMKEWNRRAALPETQHREGDDHPGPIAPLKDNAPAPADAATPRTDALLLEINEGRVYKDNGPVANLARQLERELAEANQRAAHWKDSALRMIQPTSVSAKPLISPGAINDSFVAIRPLTVEDCLLARRHLEGKTGVNFIEGFDDFCEALSTSGLTNQQVMALYAVWFALDNPSTDDAKRDALQLVRDAWTVPSASGRREE